MFNLKLIIVKKYGNVHSCSLIISYIIAKAKIPYVNPKSKQGRNSCMVNSDLC